MIETFPMPEAPIDIIHNYRQPRKAAAVFKLSAMHISCELRVRDIRQTPFVSSFTPQHKNCAEFRNFIKVRNSRQLSR